MTAEQAFQLINDIEQEFRRRPGYHTNIDNPRRANVITVYYNRIWFGTLRVGYSGQIMFLCGGCGACSFTITDDRKLIMATKGPYDKTNFTLLVKIRILKEIFTNI